jgi:hypothetical protein
MYIWSWLSVLLQRLKADCFIVWPHINEVQQKVMLSVSILMRQGRNRFKCNQIVFLIESDLEHTFSRDRALSSSTSTKLPAKVKFCLEHVNGVFNWSKLVQSCGQTKAAKTCRTCEFDLVPGILKPRSHSHTFICKQRKTITLSVHHQHKFPTRWETWRFEYD